MKVIEFLKESTSMRLVCHTWKTISGAPKERFGGSKASNFLNNKNNLIILLTGFNYRYDIISSDLISGHQNLKQNIEQIIHFLNIVRYSSCRC